MQQDLARTEKACQELEDKNQVLRSEVKTKDAKLGSTVAQLEKATRQLEQANAQVKRLETNQSSTSVQSTRRASVTPNKRESIRIGTSLEVDPQERIAELERQLVEREQETKDLEVKLFESSLAGSSLSTFDDEPLAAQRNTNRSLFPESAPAAVTPAPVAQTPGRQAIADRY